MPKKMLEDLVETELPTKVIKLAAIDRLRICSGRWTGSVRYSQAVTIPASG